MDYTQQPKEEIIGTFPEIPDVFKFSGGRLGIFEYQTPATLDQSTPVQNTWYTLLDTTANVRLQDIAITIEDTNETLQCQITIDGETLEAGSLAATHSTIYEAYIKLNSIGRKEEVILIQNDLIPQYRPFLIEGKSVKIEVRKTTAAGTGDLSCIATYGVLKDAR